MSTEARKVLGKWLQSRRYKANVDREALMDCTGYSASYIKNVECGLAYMSRARLEEWVLSIPGADLREALRLWGETRHYKKAA